MNILPVIVKIVRCKLQTGLVCGVNLAKLNFLLGLCSNAMRLNAWSVGLCQPAMLLPNARLGLIWQGFSSDSGCDKM
jgi:hypothetical protein